MFTGCGTALVTPFRKDQSLDEDALRRLVRRQIDAGAAECGREPEENPGEERRAQPKQKHAPIECDGKRKATA